MMTHVFLNKRRVRLTPTLMRGQGGEAEFYDIGKGFGLKWFKPPSHQDFNGQPHLQATARQRIEEHQRKLPAFPKNLPSNVIAPQELAKDARGRIVGYSMRYLSSADMLLSFSQKKFRAGVLHNSVRDLLRNLHAIVARIHAVNVVIGDFNDLNVLVQNGNPFLIDADSMQYGGFPCRVYTTRFVDPLLCDSAKKTPELAKPHTPNSDWYAFTVMVMQCFLYTHPYGGTYKPKDAHHVIKHDERPLKRITIFHPDVRYPRPAIPYGVLPDDLLERFHQVFEQNARGMFPLDLLENMRWTTCATCKTEHARGTCPNCATAAPAAVKQTVVIRGTVTATRIFRTTGVILNAALQNGSLRWLYHERGAYRREDQRVAIQGPLDPRMRTRIHGTATLLGKDATVIKLAPDGSTENIRVDSADNRPIFDANGENVHWTENNALLRDSRFGPEQVGEIISGLTHIWTGPRFGFGFYRAGQITVSFVWSTTARGINDTVKLPRIRGTLIDASCVFTKDRCWFFTSSQEGPHIRNRCSVIMKHGSVLASHEAIAGDGSWLSQIRGGTAVGNFLLMPTDDGVVRVEPNGDSLAVTKMFPDTEPFVDENTRLIAASDGLYAVGDREIVKLVIK